MSHGFYNEREAVDFAVGVALREEEEKHKLVFTFLFFVVEYI